MQSFTFNTQLVADAKLNFYEYIYRLTNSQRSQYCGLVNRNAYAHLGWKLSKLSSKLRIKKFSATQLKFFLFFGTRSIDLFTVCDMVADDDECLMPNACPPEATCVNFNGSYECICQQGHYLDQVHLACIGKRSTDTSHRIIRRGDMSFIIRTAARLARVGAICTPQTREYIALTQSTFIWASKTFIRHQERCQ
jgi:Calcium-binding EGF domain